MAVLRNALVLLVAIVAVASAQPDGDGPGSNGRAPPDIRALDLAIDEARLDGNTELTRALTDLKTQHMSDMGALMKSDNSVEAMRQIDSLSAELVGSTGSGE